MQIGLSDSEMETLVSKELLSLGRYTVTVPSGRPIFTKEQRDAIAHAVSSAIKANNEAIIRQIQGSGLKL